MITDQDGNVVEETFYYPFGQNTQGGVREAYLLYTNQFKDAVGCYDYGARVYCPKWYHFTSADPITANVFDPQGLNRYAYVRNNPYMYVDPTGKKAKKSGAANGYGTGSARANAVKAGRDAAKAARSGSNILVYSLQGLDGPVEITISDGSFDAFQEALKQYVEAYQNVYGDYITSVKNEEVVDFVQSEFEGLDPKIVDALAHDPYVQSGAMTLIGIQTGGWTIPFIFAVGLEGEDIYNTLQEGGTLTASDIGESTVDVGAAVISGAPLRAPFLPLLKNTGNKVVKTVYIATDMVATWIYGNAKADVVNNQQDEHEGDENG